MNKGLKYFSRLEALKIIFAISCFNLLVALALCGLPDYRTITFVGYHFREIWLPIFLAVLFLLSLQISAIFSALYLFRYFRDKKDEL